MLILQMTENVQFLAQLCYYQSITLQGVAVGVGIGVVGGIVVVSVVDKS